MAQWLADNVTEVVIVGHWTNLKPVYNVLHVRREEDDPEESARDVLNNWQDHIVNFMPNNYTVEGARFTDHNEDEGATGDIAVDVAKPYTGGLAGASIPPNSAVLVHKNISAHVGRRKGRMYLCPPTEGDVTEDGILAGAFADAFQAALDDFLDGLSGAGGNQLVVVNKKVPPTVSNAAAVNSLRLDPQIGSQRRRQR